jgi:hypothetical protein
VIGEVAVHGLDGQLGGHLSQPRPLALRHGAHLPALRRVGDVVGQQCHHPLGHL